MFVNLRIRKDREISEGNLDDLMRILFLFLVKLLNAQGSLDPWARERGLALANPSERLSGPNVRGT